MLPTPGPLELVIILVIALLILGPGRLPDVGSALGKSIREFRKASTDLGDSMKVDTSPLPPETPDAPPAPATTAPAVAPQGAALPDAPAAPTSPSTAASRPSEPTPGTN
jgi:TatA/E family protein of Tat protein translocase